MTDSDNSDTGVSPIISTILMIALTVGLLTLASIITASDTPYAPWQTAIGIVVFSMVGMFIGDFIGTVFKKFKN